MSAAMPLLRVEQLTRRFGHGGSGVGGRSSFAAVDGISFEIAEGGTWGLIGESGSGKSTTANLVLGLDKPTSGRILWQGSDVAAMRREERRAYRAAVKAVFQDPNESLNPRLRVGTSVLEPLEATMPHLTKAQRRERLESVLSMVNLSGAHGRRYPFEFSGGQRQRIAIARAIVAEPKLIVLDEPVSALDVSIRAQVMNLLQDLQQATGVAYMIISHDLATMRFLAHDIAVMFRGQIVETAPSDVLVTRPRHPYTRALVETAARHEADGGDAVGRVVGNTEVPELVGATGCRFFHRCPIAMRGCRDLPPPTAVVEASTVRCHAQVASEEFLADPDNAEPVRDGVDPGGLVGAGAVAVASAPAPGDA